MQLLDVVGSHLAHAHLARELQHVRLLARVGVDDVVRVRAQAECMLNLGLAGAVEPNAGLGEHVADPLVPVALHGVQGLDARELLFPDVQLVHHCGKIHDIERVVRGGGRGELAHKLLHVELRRQLAHAGLGEQLVQRPALFEGGGPPTVAVRMVRTVPVTGRRGRDDAGARVIGREHVLGPDLHDFLRRDTLVHR